MNNIFNKLNIKKNNIVKLIRILFIIFIIYLIYCFIFKRVRYEAMSNKWDYIWNDGGWPWSEKSDTDFKEDIDDGKYWNALLWGTSPNWDKGELYRGKYNQDKEGHKCMSWEDGNDGVWPEFLKTEEMRKQKLGDKDGNHNYCRNPDGSNKLWCYLKDAGDKKRGDCQWYDIVNEYNDNKCLKINSNWKGGKELLSEKTTEKSWQTCLKKCNLNKKCSGFTVGSYKSACPKGGQCTCRFYEGGDISSNKKEGLLAVNAKCIKGTRLYSDVDADYHIGYKKCNCKNGIAVAGKPCPSDGAFKCKTCDSGFKLVNSRCVPEGTKGFLQEIEKKFDEDSNEMVVEKVKTVIASDSSFGKRLLVRCDQCTDRDFASNTEPHDAGIDCRKGGKGKEKETEMDVETEQVKEWWDIDWNIDTDKHACSFLGGENCDCPRPDN